MGRTETEGQATGYISAVCGQSRELVAWMRVLKPFGEDIEPKCQFSQEIKKVLLFDEDFVNTIVFIETEVTGQEAYQKNRTDLFTETSGDDRQENTPQSRDTNQVKPLIIFNFMV